MALPKTEAKNIEDRRNEIAAIRGDEFFRVRNYRSYETMPEVKPYKEKPENIRFFQDGVEVLIAIEDSMRAIGTSRTLSISPMDTRYVFQLIDENKKRVLEYSIDASKDEF